jgi:hypothetical protein
MEFKGEKSLGFGCLVGDILPSDPVSRACWLACIIGSAAGQEGTGGTGAESASLLCGDFLGFCGLGLPSRLCTMRRVSYFPRRNLRLAVFHENQIEGFGQHVLNIAPLLGGNDLQLRPHFLGKKSGNLNGSLS